MYISNAFWKRWARLVGVRGTAGVVSRGPVGAMGHEARHSRTEIRKIIFSAVKSAVAAKWSRGMGLITKARSRPDIVYTSVPLNPSCSIYEFLPLWVVAEEWKDFFVERDELC